MTMAKISNRSFWNRIAIVGVGTWIGGTYLLSLIRGSQEFCFWDDRVNDYEPSNALWFALTGAVLIVVICRSIPGITMAARPRIFWKKIGVVCGSIWIGATILYALLNSASGFGFGIDEYDSDNGVWFALVGAAIIYGICWSIPWVAMAAHPTKRSN